MKKKTTRQKLKTMYPELSPCKALQELINKDMNGHQIAEYLGISYAGLRSFIFRWSCGLKWHKTKAERLHKSKTSYRRIEVNYHGKMMSLSEIARLNNLKVNTVTTRYNKGLRGEELWAPAKAGGQYTEVYELGLSQSEWEIIVDFAKNTSARQASDKFGIPSGAINCALNNQWHRLD